MYKDTIDVIIPCFNAEKTIVRALRSLELQRYSNLQVIVIDDGSSDQSVEMIRTFQNNSKLRISLYGQENKGVSSARNRGLDATAGDYVAFLDADDFYEPDFLSCLYEGMKQFDADFAFSRYRFAGNGNQEDQRDKPEVVLMGGLEMYELYAHHRTEKVNFWCGLYKRFIIEEHGISFPSKLKYGEDSVFFCQYVKHCKQGVYLKRPLYNYSITEDSAMRRMSVDRFDNIKANCLIRDYWNDSGAPADSIGGYMISRAIWAAAKDFSDYEEGFQQLHDQYDVAIAMKQMFHEADEQTIRISSLFYRISPKLFRLTISLYKKIKSREL